MDEDVLVMNPFSRLKTAPLEPDKDWRYVTLAELEQLLNACPNAGWRAFLGLCRLAGLRQGEALGLTWDKVDLAGSKLTVLAPKTKKKRVVPIEPRLAEILLAAKAEYPSGTTHVCYGVNKLNLRRTFRGICKAAGLTVWDAWCHTLRKNAETDWAQRFPQYAVSAWLGHGILVSQRHYLQVPEELYQKVAAAKPATDPKTDTAA